MYVHSKCWVFDDELAFIGSANCNNRGYTHDSEAAAVVADPKWERASWSKLELAFAHKFRIALWRSHLDPLGTDLPEEALHDPMAAAFYWRFPRKKGGIETYTQKDKVVWYNMKPWVNPVGGVVDPTSPLAVAFGADNVDPAR
jgi:phosphatidylserine/phosphatidylglycerophosphate/cardiolipin synthase-like enzyme